MKKPQPLHPLRQYREENNLSQEALGVKLGVTGMTIYRWETGDRLPQRGNWPRITKKTGLDPADFMPFAKSSAGAAA